MALMRRQSSTAHWVQLQELGLSWSQVTTRLASGSWAQPHPLVLVAGGADFAADTGVWAAWLAARYGERGNRRRDVAVGGWSAAAQLRLRPLPRPSDTRPQLWVPYSASAPALAGVQVRRVRDWEQRTFVTLAGGLRSTARVDTIADLARHLSAGDLLALVQAQAWEHPGILVSLDARCGSGRAGSGRLSGATSAVRRGIDSALHERGLRLVARAGLPRPDCTRVLVEGQGVEDCVLERPGATGPPWGIVISWSGDVHRLERQKFVHDLRRGKSLRRGGWEHLPYGIEDVNAPAATVAELRTEWRRQLALPPAGDGRLTA